MHDPVVLSQKKSHWARQLLTIFMGGVCCLKCVIDCCLQENIKKASNESGVPNNIDGIVLFLFCRAAACHHKSRNTKLLGVQYLCCVHQNDSETQSPDGASCVGVSHENDESSAAHVFTVQCSCCLFQNEDWKQMFGHSADLRKGQVVSVEKSKFTTPDPAQASAAAIAARLTGSPSKPPASPQTPPSPAVGAGPGPGAAEQGAQPTPPQQETVQPRQTTPAPVKHVQPPSGQVPIDGTLHSSVAQNFPRIVL